MWPAREQRSTFDKKIKRAKLRLSHIQLEAWELYRSDANQKKFRLSHIHGRRGRATSPLDVERSFLVMPPWSAARTLYHIIWEKVYVNQSKTGHNQRCGPCQGLYVVSKVIAALNSNDRPGRGSHPQALKNILDHIGGKLGRVHGILSQ